MDTIDSIRTRFASTPAIVNDPVVDKDGCEIVFESFPPGSLILDVDEITNLDDCVSAVIGNAKRCDFTVLTVQNDDSIVALVEVTDQRTNLPTKIYECMDQLKESFDHFDRATHRCTVPFSGFSRKAVIVAPRQRASMLRSDKFKQERSRFLNNVSGSVTLKLAQCGEDLWDEIQ